MPIYSAFTRCMLCSGWLGDANWTREFELVYHERGKLCHGHMHYRESNHYQEVSFDGANGQTDWVQVVPCSVTTVTKCLFIHTSCYRVLLEQTTSQLGVEELFRLCQALLPDTRRYFGHHAQLNLRSCLDPYDAIIPSNLATLCTGPYMETESARCDSRLLGLPGEILTMILEYLSPTDLLRLFCTSKIALDYGDSVMRTKPRQFYRCIPADNEGISKRRLLLVLSLRFPKSRNEGLDMRWEVVSRIRVLSKLIRYIATESTPPTVEIWATKTLVNHAYGLWNSFADLTTDLEVITVYGIRIKDHVYVCGIDFLTRSTHQHVGHHSKLVSRVEILSTQVDIVFFLADAFGIRSLKFGHSAWSFEEPKSDQCWEGFSIRRREGRLRIVRDAVKFRHIGWCSDTTPSFEETLLVRNSNTFWKSHIDKKYYFPLYPYWEKHLKSNLGNFTVEALWITEDLSGVTIYSETDAIIGVAIHDSSGTSTVGDDTGDKDYLPIHGPDEFLAGVVVRMHPFYEFPLLKLKTNRGRQCSSLSSVSEEEYSSRNIETPENCYIKGFYFHLGPRSIQAIEIQAIGIIYGNLGESNS